jgi:chromosome segregation ATPase
MTHPSEAPHSFPDLSRKQLEIYAREFRDALDAEHVARLALEQRNAELEQSTRELTALNETFRRHLNAYMEMLDEFQSVGGALEDLSRIVTTATRQHLQTREHLTGGGG